MKKNVILKDRKLVLKDKKEQNIELTFRHKYLKYHENAVLKSEKLRVCIHFIYLSTLPSI